FSMATTQTSTRGSRPAAKHASERDAGSRNTDLTNTDELLRVLKTYWVFDDFLPLHREAMQCVMEDRDSLVVLPTGGGKSLCFQETALCRGGCAVGVVLLTAH